MEDFNLILKNLISRDLSTIDRNALSSSLKLEFDKTADNYVKNGNLLDAIKVYAITDNKDKLISTSLLCLKENLPYDALVGFSYANEASYLDKVGFILLQIPDVGAALSAFKKSKNQEMVLFIEANFR